MRRVIVRLFFTLVGVALVGCSAPAAAPTSPPAPTQPAAAPAAAAKPTTTVRYGFSSAGAINGPLYIAESMGFLAEQGITLDYVRFPSASEVIPSITRDDVDVAGVGLNPATFNALAGNFGIKLVADTGTQFPGFPLNVVVVGKELASTIKGPADLKGRKLAMTPPGLATANGFVLAKYLKQANLTPNDVNIIPIAFPEQIAAVANGSVEAAIMAEPFATRAEQTGVATRLTSLDKVDPYQQVAGIVYSDQFIAQHRELAVKWMVAYLKAIRAYDAAFVKGQDKERIISILAAKTDVKDPAMWREMIPAGLDPNGKLNMQSITDAQAFFAQLGQIQGTPDLAPYIDTSFAEEAARILGPATSD